LRVGAQSVARATPDGYTLIQAYVATHGTAPATRKLPYDALRDFTPIGMIGTAPNVLCVYPGLLVKDVKSFIDYARKQAGNIAYGSAGAGSLTHLVGELFKLQAGKLDVQHVPYKGGGPAMQDLIAGHVPMITPIMSSAVLAQHRAGRARILGVNSDARLKAAPDIPTSVEAGVPDMRVQVFNAVFSPAGLPRDVLEFLRATHIKVRNDPGFLLDLEKAGADPFTLSDPEKFIAEEVVRWTSVIKATQFKTS
jgi:tripartite-type tricarboxylate transporter receptor subunit TctC